MLHQSSGPDYHRVHVTWSCSLNFRGEQTVRRQRTETSGSQCKVMWSDEERIVCVCVCADVSSSRLTELPWWPVGCVSDALWLGALLGSVRKPALCLLHLQPAILSECPTSEAVNVGGYLYCPKNKSTAGYKKKHTDTVSVNRPLPHH